MPRVDPTVVETRGQVGSRRCQLVTLDADDTVGHDKRVGSVGQQLIECDEEWLPAVWGVVVWNAPKGYFLRRTGLREMVPGGKRTARRLPPWLSG